MPGSTTYSIRAWPLAFVHRNLEKQYLSATLETVTPADDRAGMSLLHHHTYSHTYTVPPTHPHSTGIKCPMLVSCHQLRAVARIAPLPLLFVFSQLVPGHPHHPPVQATSSLCTPPPCAHAVHSHVSPAHAHPVCSDPGHDRRA